MFWSFAGYFGRPEFGTKVPIVLKDGDYVAWFKTARGQGTGRVFLQDGKISGGDTVIAYGGTYRIHGSRFDAILTTARHSPGQPSVFGIDEIGIKLTGTVIGNFASCAGEVGYLACSSRSS